MGSIEPTVTQETERGDKRRIDVAARFLEVTLMEGIKEDPSLAEIRKVLWKIRPLRPSLIAGPPHLSAVEKSYSSNASHMVRKNRCESGRQTQFSWSGSIFYFGFLIFEWHTAILTQKSRGKNSCGRASLLGGSDVPVKGHRNFASSPWCDSSWVDNESRGTFPNCQILDRHVVNSTEKQPYRVAFFGYNRNDDPRMLRMLRLHKNTS